MLKRLTYLIILLMGSNMLMAQLTDEWKSSQRFRYVRLTFHLPGQDYGIIQGDEYLEEPNNRPGFGIEFGKVWITGINIGHRYRLGVDGTFASLNYDKVSGENKIERLYGNTNYKVESYEYTHVYLMSLGGPNVAYLINDKTALHVALKGGIATHYFHHQESFEGQAPSYKSPGVEMQVVLKYALSLQLVHDMFLINLEYNGGNAEYSDHRESSTSTGNDYPVYEIRLDQFRIGIGMNF